MSLIRYMATETILDVADKNRIKEKDKNSISEIVEVCKKYNEAKIHILGDNDK